MGTGLVPIHLLAIIVQSNVVLKVVFEAIAAPPAGDLLSARVHPDRRAASCYQDLRAHETLLTVHQLPDIVRTFHPFVSCGTIFWAGDAVRNIPDHPPELLMAGLAFLF